MSLSNHLYPKITFKVYFPPSYEQLILVYYKANIANPYSKMFIPNSLTRVNGKPSCQRPGQVPYNFLAILFLTKWSLARVKILPEWLIKLNVPVSIKKKSIDTVYKSVVQLLTNKIWITLSLTVQTL